MDRVKVDFLKAKYGLDAPSERGVFLFPRLFLILLVVTAMMAGAMSYGVSTGQESGPLGLLGTIGRLVRSGDKPLAGQAEDRVNFLLLGVGGAGHQGAELSDTIIFASYRPSTKQIGLLSIPRDLAVPIPGQGTGRVNSVNAYQGPEGASKVIGEVLGQEIHYYVKVNFDGFAELIDELGGIDVFVDRAFTDSAYPVRGQEEANCGTTTTVTDEEDNEVEVPTYGCRFEVLSFAEGWTPLDGATALKFVRSRHGTNGEGSDFARAARQQKVLLAVKAKLLSASTLFNPGRVVKLFDLARQNIDTNLTGWEIGQLAAELPGVGNDQITHHVLDETGPLYSAIINGAYLLLPDNNDWAPVRRIAANIFAGDTGNLALDEPAAAARLVKVEIQNGTTLSGMASQAAQILTAQGYEVMKIGNAATRGYTQTIIYDLRSGAKSAALQDLARLLKGDVSMSAAGWVYTNEIIPTELSVSEDAGAIATETDIDFLVILGENTAPLVMREL